MPDYASISPWLDSIRANSVNSNSSLPRIAAEVEFKPRALAFLDCVEASRIEIPTSVDNLPCSGGQKAWDHGNHDQGSHRLAGRGVSPSLTKNGLTMCPQAALSPSIPSLQTGAPGPPSPLSSSAGSQKRPVMILPRCIASPTVRGLNHLLSITDL